LQYKTPQGSVIVAAVTEKARALAQVMKEQNATAATTKPKSKDNAKKKTAKKEKEEKVSGPVVEASDSDEAEGDDDDDDSSDEDEEISEEAPAAATATADDSDEEEEDDDENANVFGQTMYDVKQGRSKLQLQVGSMALQVFKGGKPVDNYLYKDMGGWLSEADVVHIEIDSPAGKNLKYTTANAADAKSIIAQMTSNAKALAKAKAEQKKQQQQQAAPKQQKERGSNSSDGSSSAGGGSGSKPKRTDSKESGGGGVDLAAAQLGTGVAQYDVKRETARGAKGGNMQLQVGSLALQMFKNGAPVESILFAKITSWAPDQRSEGLVITLKGGAVERFSCSGAQASEISDVMTMRAKDLQASKAAAKETKRKEEWAAKLQTMIGQTLVVSVMSLDLREDQSTDADVFQALNEGEEVVVEDVAPLSEEDGDGEDGADKEAKKKRSENGCLYVKGESADPHSGFVSVKSGWVNLRNRAGDLQLEEKKPEGLTSLNDVSAGDKLRVLAKATIRTGSDPTSEVAGALRKGSVFEVMDAVMHVGDSDDEDDEAAGGRLRVQCAKGWTSTVSARGVVMCEKLSEEASKAAELKLDFDPSSARKRHFLSHLYIKCIILPRQARDEHRENSKKVPFSLRVRAVLYLVRPRPSSLSLSLSRRSSRWASAWMRSRGLSATT
jgi:hypothetical protein